MLGDPYHCECQKTARLLGRTARAGKPDQLLVTFQSRFGKAEWLEPYTEPTLVALAQAGHRRVDVMCPGFTSDCLETLEEIALEARAAYLGAGGERFHYIPCLNDQHEWIVALADVAAPPSARLGHRNSTADTATRESGVTRAAIWEPG